MGNGFNLIFVYVRVVPRVPNQLMLKAKHRKCCLEMLFCKEYKVFGVLAKYL